MAGRVRVDGRLVTKAGTPIAGDAELDVEQGPAFVSRGGDKLATALAAFAIDVSGLVCLDVGASTGGFTDCLLQRGAAHVTALDVGRGQLHERLRRDDRVTLLEGVNARLLAPGDLPGPAATLAVVDVSFISLALVLPPLVAVLAHPYRLLPLVKPQFEAGRAETRARRRARPGRARGRARARRGRRERTPAASCSAPARAAIPARPATASSSCTSSRATIPRPPGRRPIRYRCCAMPSPDRLSVRRVALMSRRAAADARERVARLAAEAGVELLPPEADAAAPTS